MARRFERASWRSKAAFAWRDPFCLFAPIFGCRQIGVVLIHHGLIGRGSSFAQIWPAFTFVSAAQESA